MSRRTVASLVAVVLLIGLLVTAARMPVPYVSVSPGPTVDILGKNGDKPIVAVEGHRRYPTEGQLRLTTVSVSNPDSELSLATALAAWLRTDVAVLPYAAMYPEPSTTEQERAESAAQMVSSQDTAVAVALTELGYDLTTHTEVTGVSPGGPSEDRLQPRDRIESIDGTPIEDVDALLAALGKVRPGSTVAVGVRRDGRSRAVDIKTEPAADDPKRAVLGILVGTGYDFPFDVRVRIDESIGGPSAGLMFALSVYDTLTPGALTDGATVAGTGTISADGKVGPIGGVRQKILGAEESGASVFLVPPDNCASAVLAGGAGEIELVRADTMSSAVDSLESYAQDPNADLPRCPS
jgi:PDZ domain-containing protein